MMPGDYTLSAGGHQKILAVDIAVEGEQSGVRSAYATQTLG
jgi:hypothetical protein